MKKIFYVILPSVAIFVILMNMLYGHLLFVSTSDQVINKYEVYVHLQPDWNLDQKNMVFDITNLWYKEDSTINSEKENNNNHNFNELRFLGNKSFVELKHDFSDCQDEWKPLLYRKVVDTLRYEIETIQGKQIISDPETPMYPIVENESYDKIEQQLRIKEGFSQFIPICTSKEKTWYDYSIKIDSDNLGFDVYFVPSLIEQNDFHDPTKKFDFYLETNCHAQNMKSFTGSCDDVEQKSGLLIIIPNILDKPLTKVFVTLKEKEF